MIRGNSRISKKADIALKIYL